MKTAIIIAGILALIGVGYLLALQFEPTPDNSALIAEHKAQKQEYQSIALGLTNEVIRLQGVIDSLKAIEPEIEKQIVYLQAEVDSSISLDSLNAIVEYRKGLELLKIRTENTLTLTFREIGLGALTFRETHGLRLNVANLHNIVDEQETLIDKQHNLIEMSRNVMISDSIIIAEQEYEIKQKDSFWRNRFIVYAGVGMNWSGEVFAPGIQIGVGFRIVGND